MKVNFKYSNGQIVTDSVSGITGTINQSTIMDTGNIQYSILPKSKDGIKREDSWFIDEASLEMPEGKTCLPYEHNFKFETGMKVKCKVTGFEGYITRAILDHNNCVRYTLTGHYNYKTGEPNYHYVDEKYIEPLDSKKLDTQRSTTGCVSTRSNQRLY